MIEREHGSEQGTEELSFEQWIEKIEGANREAVRRFMGAVGNRDRLLHAPGSREAHQAWEGGYAEHVRQTMRIAAHNLSLMEAMGLLAHLPEEERFNLSDALTVLFLHDIEKPFIYEFDEEGKIVTLTTVSKDDRKAFRATVIERYGFELTATMENALEFVEGVHDKDYIPGKRADQPLAALCHAADNLSARAYYDYGKPRQ